MLTCTPVACRARSQRLLESTWDDLLARQAAEAQAAKAFAAWLAPAPPRSQPASPVAQGPLGLQVGLGPGRRPRRCAASLQPCRAGSLGFHKHLLACEALVA